MFTTGTGANDGITISIGSVVSLSGHVTFTRNASTGRVNVDIPDASVSISAPWNGQIQPIVGVTGVASFAFGGTDGFQLNDLRVNGFTLFGETATIAAPASSLRPVTQDLYSPLNGALLDVANLKYMDVVFNDVNHVGVDAGARSPSGDAQDSLSPARTATRPSR